MKILYVITSLLMGGAEKLVVDLVPRLRSKGHVVDVAVFNGEDTPLMDKLKKEEPNTKIYKLGHNVYNPLLIFKLTRIMKQYDIVHTHNSSPQLFTAIAGVLCSVELVSTEHNTSNRKRGWKWYAPIESWMYNRYSHTICISKIAEDELRKYMGGDWIDSNTKKYNKISTINNGVDVETIHKAIACKDLIKLKENRKAILMVAGFREAKDQDTVVKTLSLLDKEKFEVWFAGIGNRENTVKKLTKDFNVSKRVRFLGMRTDIPNVLKAADYIVMASHWEGLSLSNVEGMSAGKPFIASDVNGLREVTKGYGLLFKESNVNELKEIIHHLYKDKDFSEKIAQRCFERAKQFDINKMVEGYNKIYNMVMNSKA